MIFKITAYLLAPFYLLALLWRGRGAHGNWRGLEQRLGYGAPLPSPVWLHAASAGEVQAAAILVTALRQRDPHLPLLVTTTTAAGLARARTLFESQSVAVRFVPLDLPGAVRRFLRGVQPRLAIILETEIWPNLLLACSAAQVPVVFASARLSARSVRRYQRLGAALQRVLGTVAAVAAQTPADAQRFAALGVPATRITVCGNLKADFEVPETVAAAGSELRTQLGQQRSVWVAGSTHELEERLVLAAHRALRQVQPAALLVLVPRQPRRFAAVSEWLQREQVVFARRSQADPVNADTQVLLVDELGQLLDFYAAADLAFVGGSLVGVGGHNLLEPAALARAIITGPNHANAREILAALVAADAVRVVAEGIELTRAVAELLADPQARARLGAHALAVVAASRGAGARLLRVLDATAGAALSPGRS